MSKTPETFAMITAECYPEPNHAIRVSTSAIFPAATTRGEIYKELLSQSAAGLVKAGAGLPGWTPVVTFFYAEPDEVQS